MIRGAGRPALCRCSTVTHSPQRFDGAACEACYDIAFELVAGPLADALRIFGRAAYNAGQAHESETTAAERAIIAVGQFAQDGIAIDKLLNGREQRRI